MIGVEKIVFSCKEKREEVLSQNRSDFRRPLSIAIPILKGKREETNERVICFVERNDLIKLVPKKLRSKIRESGNAVAMELFGEAERLTCKTKVHIYNNKKNADTVYS